MFRTVILRSDVAKEIVRKTVRSQVIRNISSHCTRKRLYQRTLFAVNHTQILRPWTIAEENLVRNYSSNYPAHTKVTLPALSPTMEMGTIISWEKKEGDKLNEGDLLAEIETDKATMGFETPEEGYLAKILIPPGTKDIPIGKLVCIIVENEADVAAFKDFKDDAPSAPAPAAPKPSAPSPTAAAAPPPLAAISSSHAPPAAELGAGGRVYASPMAKRLAEQRNIRLQGRGTGLFGALTSTDLTDLPVGGAKAKPKPRTAGVPAPAQAPSHVPSGPPSGAAFTDLPVSNIRRTIAKRLLESKQQIPHYYLTVEINVDALLSTRVRLNKKFEKSGVKLSVNDFIIKAVAVACKKVPDANSYWMDTVIRKFKNVDVSVAVSTDKGLITPIVFQADSKGVSEISKDVKALAAKARDGKLQPQEFQGGTISVSNLGMFGVGDFCAIINPPQSCIVAIGTTSKRLVADESEKGFKESNFMSITLSADHRTVDGAVGAEFLKVLKGLLEDPVTMIV